MISRLREIESKWSKEGGAMVVDLRWATRQIRGLLDRENTPAPPPADPADAVPSAVDLTSAAGCLRVEAGLSPEHPFPKHPYRAVADYLDRLADEQKEGQDNG